jgi:hypothetical protein
VKTRREADDRNRSAVQFPPIGCFPVEETKLYEAVSLLIMTLAMAGPVGSPVGWILVTSIILDSMGALSVT